MKRYIWNELLQWKNSSDRKPLILRGARQVGKTWLMKEFGKAEYDDVLYINCDDEPRAVSLFETDYDINRILLQLQAITGISAKPGKTLIVLDEVQAIPRGLASLKYFYEKAPEYHVMVAGSLLGIALHSGTSFPVGKVDMLTVYPMDFREFLMAMGHEQWVEWIKDKNWVALEPVAEKIESYLRQYYYVGGMPEVVQHFVINNDLGHVRYLQKMILNAYVNDVSKHAPVSKVPRINMVMRSIPSQLAKDNKKFVYGVLKSGARAREFELAIQWLIDCGIINKVSCVSDVKLPLSFYENMSAFKLYFIDCGLLGALAGVSAELIITSNKIFSEFKGAFTEQYVLQQLLCRKLDGIYYWTSEATAEVDFVIQQGYKVIPIEVKAEINVKAKSLKLLVDRHQGMHGVRYSMRGYSKQDWVTNYPLYSL